eukprot:m.271414 g.271414  ORF g.271414 m.271414 type:complete len:64 (-) comp95184_c0_seq1:92-283(-)
MNPGDALIAVALGDIVDKKCSDESFGDYYCSSVYEISLSQRGNDASNIEGSYEEMWVNGCVDG